MNTGQIIKSKTTERFTTIPNEMLQDSLLSAKAKGVLCYLLSLPPDWVVHQSELYKHFKDGKDSIRAGFKELIENGYIKKIGIRNDKGHFKGYNYIVYDLPKSENPKTVTPKTVKPKQEKPQLLKTNSTNEILDKRNTILKTHSKESIKKKSLYPEDFILFCEDVIENLNETLQGGRYKNTKTNQKLIKRQYDEGFTLEDFQQVHKNQYFAWIDSDKMRPFLRPSTLYGGNFQSYLNNKPIKQSEKKELTFEKSMFENDDLRRKIEQL